MEVDAVQGHTPEEDSLSRRDRARKGKRGATVTLIAVPDH